MVVGQKIQKSGDNFIKLSCYIVINFKAILYGLRLGMCKAFCEGKEVR